jgi:hypothetical protein
MVDYAARLSSVTATFAVNGPRFCDVPTWETQTRALSRKRERVPCVPFDV